MRYLLALALVALALACTLALAHFQSGRPPLVFFSVAIVAAAWFGGVGPGCLAAAASLPAGFYFYASSLPATSLTVDNVVLFVFFSLCAVVGGFLSSRQREADAKLEAKAAELSQANMILKREASERRRAEDALADAKAKLAHAARLTALGELTATIAHEVNQPLAAVVTNADCCVRLLDAPQPDLAEAREAAASVVQDAARAGEVIKRIRAMVRRAPVERAPLDLNALARDSVGLLDNELRRGDVALHFDLEPQLPRILGDAVQLQQVVLNVTSNAIEALSGQPERRLTFRSRRLSDRYVALFVSDTGAGFAGREPRNVFDAFVTNKSEGLGLGLSICRSIVENHGGYIRARDQLPHGALIEIVLPIEARP